VDALVFEFMGMMVLALCVIVMVVPPSAPEARQRVRR